LGLSAIRRQLRDLYATHKPDGSAGICRGRCAARFFVFSIAWSRTMLNRFTQALVGIICPR